MTKVVSQLPDLVESLTGIDILATLKNLPRVVATSNGADDATTAAPVASDDGDGQPEDGQ